MGQGRRRDHRGLTRMTERGLPAAPPPWAAGSRPLRRAWPALVAVVILAAAAVPACSSERIPLKVQYAGQPDRALHRPRGRLRGRSSRGRRADGGARQHPGDPPRHRDRRPGGRGGHRRRRPHPPAHVRHEVPETGRALRRVVHRVRHQPPHPGLHADRAAHAAEITADNWYRGGGPPGSDPGPGRPPPRRRRLPGADGARPGPGAVRRAHPVLRPGRGAPQPPVHHRGGGWAHGDRRAGTARARDRTPAC